MKITQIELIPIYSTREMGRTGPSDPEQAVSHHLIVRLKTDAGITGLGEMSDVNFRLTPESVSGLHRRLESLLVGQNPFDLTAIYVAWEGQTWEHQVVCGLDIALHDIIGTALDIPLYQLFGGKYRERIPFAYPLAPCKLEADVEANLKRIERLLDQGHSTIRYYFGADLTLDERFLSKLREQWHLQVEINALDASGRFDVQTAIDVIQRFTRFKPNLVESPISGRHEAAVEDFIAVQNAVKVPLSEHVADQSVAVRLARHQAVQVFNLGIGYSGITACRKLFGLAEIFGIKTVMGSTVELSIGTAARAHLAAAVQNLDFPCYLAGPLVYQEQVVHQPVRYEEGHIIVPEGPGLGLQLNEQRLQEQRLW
jgi:muconate cycloisomerase